MSEPINYKVDFTDIDLPAQKYITFDTEREERTWFEWICGKPKRIIRETVSHKIILTATSNPEAP